jgi:DNA polymerase III alpha subunit
MGRFVPLHVYSHYSLFEGVDGPAALAERAAECGYTDLALTDVNSLAGAVEFAEASRRFSVRPILGARLRHQSQQATALIAEPAGWKSLCRIISRIHLRGTVPLASLLADNADGLHVLLDNPFALKPPLSEAFRGRLWVELLRPGVSEATERALAEVGSRFGARPVATLGAHFAAAGGYWLFRLLTAIRQGQPLEELPGRLAAGPPHHLATPDEVAERFRDLPDALPTPGGWRRCVGRTCCRGAWSCRRRNFPMAKTPRVSCACCARGRCRSGPGRTSPPSAAGWRRNWP